jgi:hypothetical protein
MSRQAQKYYLSLAGEFYVAAELQRRGIAAAVTYGNAKSADVVAFSNAGHAVVIEVKSTSDPQWVVGGAVPEPSSKPWVFVHIPRSESDPPSFYIMSQRQLHDIVDPVEVEYRRRYLAKHHEEYGDRTGVVNLSRKQAESSKDAWPVIFELLESSVPGLEKSPLQRRVRRRSGHD